MITGKSPADTRYTQLHLGATRLLLAQSGIRDIEGVDDINPTDPPMGGVGWIRVNHHDYPVYCLSDEFDQTEDIPESYRMCVLLADDESEFGLLCSQVKMLDKINVSYPFPECMRIQGSPVEALVLQPDGIACLSSVQRLAAKVFSEKRHVGTHQTETSQAGGVYA